MNRFLLGLTALALASPAVAADVAETPPQASLALWNNLTIGLSKAEFKALYPSRRTELGEGCVANVAADFSEGKLTTVRLEYSFKSSKAAFNRCAEVVGQALWAKHGQPEASASNVEIPDCGDESEDGILGALASICEGLGGEEPKVERLWSWTKNGVEITFKEMSDNDSQWWLVYRPAIQASKTVQDNL